MEHTKIIIVITYVVVSWCVDFLSVKGKRKGTQRRIEEEKRWKTAEKSWQEEA